MARHVRLVTVIFVAVALALALLVGGRLFLSSDAGRAMIVRALPLYAPKSGLRVTAGRIEGNIFGSLRIHDLALADPAGVFARVPVLDLAWRPLTLLEKRLTVKSATAAEMAVLRRPHLRPSADERILPDIDIVVGHLSITRLDLAAPVTGIAEVIGVDGSGEAVAGRAQITLAATSATGGDAVRLHLDAVPDADRFDFGATVAAPAKGTLARLLGLPAAVDAAVGGKGTWRDWHGTAKATIGGRPLADLALTEMQGRGIVAGHGRPVAAARRHGRARRRRRRPAARRRPPDRAAPDRADRRRLGRGQRRGHRHRRLRPRNPERSPPHRPRPAADGAATQADRPRDRPRRARRRDRSPCRWSITS